jgi:hypothetical protein
MNWKGCGRKRSWPNERCYFGIFLEGLRKTKKNLSQDSWSPGRDLNPGPSEYEVGVDGMFVDFLHFCLDCIVVYEIAYIY